MNDFCWGQVSRSMMLNPQTVSRGGNTVVAVTCAYAKKKRKEFRLFSWVNNGRRSQPNLRTWLYWYYLCHSEWSGRKSVLFWCQSWDSDPHPDVNHQHMHRSNTGLTGKHWAQHDQNQHNRDLMETVRWSVVPQETPRKQRQNKRIMLQISQQWHNKRELKTLLYGKALKSLTKSYMDINTITRLHLQLEQFGSGSDQDWMSTPPKCELHLFLINAKVKSCV